MRTARAGLGVAGLLVALVLASSALFASSASAGTDPGAVGAPRAQKSGSIYFWANLGNPVSTPVHGFPNPFVIRPRTLIIFEDGSWQIEKLHWTGWGSPVARAKGISNADNDVPNVAEGKRIRTPATVTLSNPGVFRGKRVYRCIAMKLQPPAHFDRVCLQRTGNSVVLGPPGTGTPVGDEANGGARHLRSFFSPDRKVWCVASTAIGGVDCGTYPEPPTRSAEVRGDGHVALCEVLKLEYPDGSHVPAGCFQNWPSPADHTSVLGIGEISAVSGFRCTAATDGITCIKGSGAGKGKGFRIDKDEAVEVG